MGVTQNSKSKKNLNVELNLLPVFDILSVCICFLLMTVVWVEIRSIETKQALGSQSLVETEKQPSVWLTIDENNNLLFILKPLNGIEKKIPVVFKNGNIDYEKAKTVFTQAYLENMKSTHIMPAKNTKYDQVIRLMDLAKQVGIQNIGLSPI